MTIAIARSTRDERTTASATSRSPAMGDSSAQPLRTGFESDHTTIGYRRRLNSDAQSRRASAGTSPAAPAPDRPGLRHEIPLRVSNNCPGGPSWPREPRPLAGDSPWRDPDSNRGHHDFQALGTTRRNKSLLQVIPAAAALRYAHRLQGIIRSLGHEPPLVAQTRAPACALVAKRAPAAVALRYLTRDRRPRAKRHASWPPLRSRKSQDGGSPRRPRSWFLRGNTAQTS